MMLIIRSRMKHFYFLRLYLKLDIEDILFIFHSVVSLLNWKNLCYLKIIFFHPQMLTITFFVSSEVLWQILIIAHLTAFLLTESQFSLGWISIQPLRVKQHGLKLVRMIPFSFAKFSLLSLQPGLISLQVWQIRVKWVTTGSSSSKVVWF